MAAQQLHGVPCSVLVTSRFYIVIFSPRLFYVFIVYFVRFIYMGRHLQEGGVNNLAVTAASHQGTIKTQVYIQG